MIDYCSIYYTKQLHEVTNKSDTLEQQIYVLTAAMKQPNMFLTYVLYREIQNLDYKFWYVHSNYFYFGKDQRLTGFTND